MKLKGSNRGTLNAWLEWVESVPVTHRFSEKAWAGIPVPETIVVRDMQCGVLSANIQGLNRMVEGAGGTKFQILQDMTLTAAAVLVLVQEAWTTSKKEDKRHWEGF